MGQLHEAILRLPRGYETQLGSSGGAAGEAFSGGEKQRLILARALATRPSLLLLDEATSALDAETEAAVLGALQELRKDRTLTVVAVAHRMAAVRQG